MALEDNILALIEAIKENTAAVKAAGRPAPELTERTAETPAEPKRRGRPRKTETEAPSPAELAEEKGTEPANEMPDDLPVRKPDVTAEMVRDVMLKVKDVRGKEVASALVRDYGKVEKLVQVQPEHYAALYVQAEAVLAEEEDEI